FTRFPRRKCGPRLQRDHQYFR
ncbi:hypothetical protein D047_4201B, partial [Vibrio parahaemolyticus VPTS-2010_2]